MADIRDVWLHAHSMIRSARQRINESLRPLNLSSAEGNILLHLLAQDQEMAQEQIVAQLDVTKPAVSRALASLEGKGLVTRHRDPRDRRVYRVRLTARAREIGPAIEKTYNRLYTLAMQDISPDELDCFLRLFGRISENLDREQDTEVACCLTT
jgi:DNA-binding MarR family transcriptional regulator